MLRSDKDKKHIIRSVVKGSIAEELGICSGDALISIDGNPLEDIFDYQYLTQSEVLTVVIEKEDGEEWEFDIEKDEDEDLGIVFENGLMDNYRSCRNKCIFCFIDQMPKGMRPTLYFKDDDSRLSFLQGNYITLTNISGKDLDRIIKYRLSPINISIHTMNPELRCKMLGNRFAGDALKNLDRLYEAGLTMNGQIVLCKGINDGDELEFSIKEMMKYAPVLESVSVVPVGLTKYREGLCHLEPFEPDDSRAVIALIEKYQKECYEKHGIHFIHASDEWYINAGYEVPEEDRYDGYLQLENGVGMVRMLKNAFYEALNDHLRIHADDLSSSYRKRTISLATGKLAYGLLRELSDACEGKFEGLKINVFCIENRFFGERITVSGLITGSDLRDQLKGKEIGEELFIPVNMLRAGEDVFLDDVTLSEVMDSLQVPVSTIKLSGCDLLDKLLGN